MKKNIYSQKIARIELPSIHVIKIHMNDGSEYICNLSDDFFELDVFPKTMEEWKKAKIGQGKFSIEWQSGFDIHFDHIIELSKIQKISA